MVVFVIGVGVASVSAQPFDYEWGMPLRELFQKHGGEDGERLFIGDSSWEDFKRVESRSVMLDHRGGPWSYGLENVHEFLGENALVILLGNRTHGLLSVKIQMLNDDRSRLAPLPVGIEDQYERKYGLPARESVSNGRPFSVWEEENGARIYVYGPSFTSSNPGWIYYRSPRLGEMVRERNAAQDADL